MQSRMVKQANLSSECWTIQFWGLSACKECQYKGKRECGGKNIIKTLKNKKGIEVPV